MRTTGFQRPFHVLQITSWIVFSVDAAVFSAIGFPLLRGGAAAQAVVGTLYFLSIVSLIIAAVFATKCNPQDPHLKRRGSKEAPFTREELDELPYCEDCDCPVFPRSKHCRACDKCVHVFDHHCKWLNNCIGQYNYHWFAQAVVSVAVMTGIVLLGSISILIDYIVDEALLDERLLAAGGGYTDTPKEAVVAVLAVLVVVNTPLCLLDLQLVMFHAYLTSQKLTTFEYIMNKRELEEEEEARIAMGQKPRRRALPSCMDWIVYKAKKRKAKEPPPEVPADEVAEGEVVDAPMPTAQVTGGQCLNDKIAAGFAATNAAEGTAPSGGQASAAAAAGEPQTFTDSEAEALSMSRSASKASALSRAPAAAADGTSTREIILSTSEGPNLEIARPAVAPGSPPSTDDIPRPPQQPQASATV